MWLFLISSSFEKKNLKTTSKRLQVRLESLMIEDELYYSELNIMINNVYNFIDDIIFCKLFRNKPLHS